MAQERRRKRTFDYRDYWNSNVNGFCAALTSTSDVPGDSIETCHW